MAQMFKSIGVDQTIAVCEILAADDYSPIWWVIGDFTVNGHKISVGDTKQWHHIILDGCYFDIKCPKGIPDWQDEHGAWHYKTVTAMEYLRMKLSSPVEEEDRRV